MATQEDTTFQEALTAIHKGEKERARDLLTRLIKINPDQSQYWLWMSTAVDTNKERVFCLKETLKRDPKNATARRGLILKGELPPDPNLAIPAHLQHRYWEAGFFDDLPQLAKLGRPFGLPLGVVLGIATALILIVGIILAGLSQTEIPGFIVWLQRYTPAPTSANVPAFLVTSTAAPSVLRTNTPPSGLLTATPVALYVNTPHPRTESYQAAVVAFQKGDLSSAVNYLLQVLKEDLKPDIYYLLGETYRLQNKPKDAAQSYDLVIKQDPKFAPAYLGRAQLRLVTAPDQTQPVRADLVEAYLEMARYKIGNKYAASALTNLETARQLALNSTMPYYYRAQDYLALNQPGYAVVNARQANHIDPASLPAYRLLAETKRAAGDLNGSIKPLDIYKQSIKDHTDTFAWLGQAYAAGGDTTTALRMLDQAVPLNNQSYEALLKRGFVYIEMANASKTQADLRQAYLLRSDAFAVSLGLGRIAPINQDGSEAWQSLTAALGQAKTDVKNAQAYFWRAQSFELNKQFSQAIADWNEMLRLPASGLTGTLRATALPRQQALITATPPTGTTTSTATSIVIPTLAPGLAADRQGTQASTLTSSATAMPIRIPSAITTARPIPISSSPLSS